MKWLTMKLMQYIAGALLLTCIGLGAKGCSLASERDTAVAKQGEAEALTRAANTERAAWKSKAGDLAAANAACDTAFDQLQAAATERDRQVEQQTAQAEQAIAASKAKAAAAGRELAEFRRLYGQRPANCEAALKSLDRVCPAWRY